jgi:hypothetical protein
MRGILGAGAFGLLFPTALALGSFHHSMGHPASLFLWRPSLHYYAKIHRDCRILLPEPSFPCFAPTRRLFRQTKIAINDSYLGHQRDQRSVRHSLVGPAHPTLPSYSLQLLSQLCRALVAKGQIFSLTPLPSLMPHQTSLPSPPLLTAPPISFPFPFPATTSFTALKSSSPSSPTF